MSLTLGTRSCAGRKALVAFSGQADLPWLRLLKPGFRHCLVAVDFAGYWIVVNPLSNRMDMAVCNTMTAEQLANFYQSKGLRVVHTRTLDPGRKPVSWRPFTCVEVVLRILGLRAPLILTPWQLFRKISVNMKKSLDKPEK
ncbi:MAG: hypothetical protein HN403_13465 [Rhodospirillales bacterium]|jgi:hypothetical protein|nr:hypothetical protein [Rhodospirillales bacterium]